MSRPADWLPLTEDGSDPMPGDPAAVSGLARRYADTATEISAQVATLRRLGGTDWDSDAGEEFKKHAADCAEKLDQAHHRYETAGSALRDWVQPLGDAQTHSLTLLANAQTAAASQARYAQHPVMTAADAPPPTPAQKAAADNAERVRQGHYNAATDDLNTARRQLQTALDALHHTASGIAGRIQDAIHHDGLKDSWWQSFKAWVHDNAGWIKVVTEIAGWIATALCVIALFIPGIDVLVILGVMAVALLGHSVLAAAGEGSWVDVILDVVGMATFGVGSVATRGAAEAAETMETTAGRVAARQAASRARGELADVKQGLTRTLQKSTTPKAVRIGARNQLAALAKAERTAGRTAATKLLADIAKPASVGRRAITGDAEIAQIAKNAKLLKESYKGVVNVPKVAAATAAAASRARTAAVPLQTSWGLDWTRHGIDTGVHFGLPGLPEWEAPIGGDW